MALLLSRAPLALTVAVFLLGLTLSVVGAVKFRSARQSRLYVEPPKS